MPQVQPRSNSAATSFNIERLPLSRLARHQLSRALLKIGTSCRLTELIRKNLFDRSRGLYIPLSQDVYLEGKLPDLSVRIQQSQQPGLSGAALFTNILAIPIGYGENAFDPAAALHPNDRAVNGHFVVVTLEIDSQSVAELEQMLAWLRGEEAAIDLLDDVLCKIKEYRGYTAIYSGNRSIHFHFVFNIKNLAAVPPPLDHTAYIDLQTQHSALMHSVHNIYYDHVLECFNRVLSPLGSPDKAMRSWSQWRRAPWGIRRIEKASNLFGLAMGTPVPQLVLSENIRSRSTPGSKDMFVPSSFSLSHQLTSAKKTAVSATIATHQNSHEALIERLRELFRSEWGGEYPKLAKVSQRSRLWTLNFFNHPDDRKPSTYVSGMFRQLTILGRSPFTSPLFLPGGETAQSLVTRVALQCGFITHVPNIGASMTNDAHSQDAHIGRDDQNAAVPAFATPPENAPASAPADIMKDPQVIMDTSCRAACTSAVDDLRRRPPFDLVQALQATTTAMVWRAVTSEDKKSVVSHGLYRAMGELRSLKQPYLIKAPEGSGKGRSHVQLVQGEAIDRACTEHGDSRKRFDCVALRSNAQAKAKADECSQNGCRSVYIQSVWSATYKECCDLEDVPVIPRTRLPGKLEDALAYIRRKQPKVYARMEAYRKALWKGPKGEDLFNPATTLLFTSQALAKTFYRSRDTRLYIHPAFRPNDPEHNKSLQDRIVFFSVLHDELEIDDILIVFTETQHRFISEQQAAHGGWSSLPRIEKIAIHAALRGSRRLPDWQLSYEQFDELMRTKLSDVEQFSVSYDRIPYGCDSKEKGLYRGTSGQKFFIGVKNWPWASETLWSFMTTETLPTEIVTMAYRRQCRRLNKVELDDLPGLFPQKIPVFIDSRAAADRGENLKVTALAREITTSDPAGVVLSNGVKGVDRVVNMQNMKGRNDLTENSTYVVMTMFPSDQYARLNVIGQWIDRTDVIALYYQDQLDQAVGRNQGFRGAARKQCSVIMTSRLWGLISAQLFPRVPGRTALYEVYKRPW